MRRLIALVFLGGTCIQCGDSRFLARDKCKIKLFRGSHQQSQRAADLVAFRYVGAFSKQCVLLASRSAGDYIIRMSGEFPRSYLDEIRFAGFRYLSALPGSIYHDYGEITGEVAIGSRNLTPDDREAWRFPFSKDASRDVTVIVSVPQALFSDAPDDFDLRIDRPK